ncbi:MAG: hypothetical protein ACK4UU_05195, partial [Fimbriimonadales bacterium]
MRADNDKKFDIVKQFMRHRKRKSPPEAWEELKKEFIQVSKATDPAQAWKTASGKAFEEIVRKEFQNQIKACRLGSSVEVQQWKDVKNSSVKRILSDTLWSRCTLEKTYVVASEVDLVAIEKEGEHV